MFPMTAAMPLARIAWSAEIAGVEKVTRPAGLRAGFTGGRLQLFEEPEWGSLARISGSWRRIP
jgi:hypothetical protein